VGFIRSVTAVLVAMSLAEAGLSACGDKFFVLGRGTRFERPAIKRQPARVVVYAPPASGLPKALSDLPIEQTLVKAGYSTRVVTSLDDVRAAVESGVDLVMLDLVDAPKIADRVSTAFAPAVLPVVFGKKDAEIAALLKGFTCSVSSPKKNQSFLDAVDEALDKRRAAMAASGVSGR
jgi:hypothetical protein